LIPDLKFSVPLVYTITHAESKFHFRTYLKVIILQKTENFTGVTLGISNAINYPNITFDSAVRV